MSQSRHLGVQGGLHVFAGNKQFHRLDPRVERRLQEILALGDEEPELVAPAAFVQLPDELELLVLARGDQAA
jgi:hypothetical protein